MAEPKVRSLAEAQVWSISKVKPHPTNPRKISDRAVELLAAVLVEFGWKQPLVVDTDGVIVVGHTRFRAAQRLKLKQVPVIVADDLSPEQIRAYRIADNRTHDFTTWDYPVLTTELDELAADFSDVLALEDWQAVADEFDTALDLEPEIKADMTGNGFEITIVFASKEQALAAEPGLIDLDGALDVRHKFVQGERVNYVDRLQKIQEASNGSAD